MDTMDLRFGPLVPNHDERDELYRALTWLADTTASYVNAKSGEERDYYRPDVDHALAQANELLSSSRVPGKETHDTTGT